MEVKRVFNTILYENEFQNPPIFQQTISLFPEHSTLEVLSSNLEPLKMRLCIVLHDNATFCANSSQL
jgi:hypothetical protein